MIAALLHGRTHLNFQEFRQQSHLTFFLHVLGVLELLQPHVFQSEHQGALWDCLLSFIRLLLVRGPDPLSTGLCPSDAAAWVVGPLPGWAQAGTQKLCTLTLTRLSQLPHRQKSLPVQLVPLLLPSNQDWWVLPLLHPRPLGEGRHKPWALQGSWDPSKRAEPVSLH